MKLEVQYKDEVKKVVLSSLKAGDVFHFSTSNFTEAVAEEAFYKVTNLVKDSRTTIVCEKDGMVLVRDGSHLVVKVDAKLVLTC